MSVLEKCPVCGGDLKEKEVEELVRGGHNTASMQVIADVCQHCGERLYSLDVVKSFEQIRNKLARQEFTHLKSLGQSFTVAEDWPNKAIRPTF